MSPNHRSNGETIKALLALVQIVMTTIAGYVASEIKDMSHSINSLNIQIASLLTETSDQKEKIQNIDRRVFSIETKSYR